MQHPMEEHHAKGSARLLHLSLPGSRLVVGETFAPSALQALLDSTKHNLLLYPDTPPGSAQHRPQSPDLEWSASGPSAQDPTALVLSARAPSVLPQPAHIRLVVIDGTWRKSRKMIYANPLLQALPRLSLRNLPASRYAVRKAHRPDQRSTLEATCAALAQLEGSAVQCAPLLAAFEGLVAQQMEYRSQLSFCMRIFLNT